MPPGFQLLDNFVSSITYEFSPQDGAVSRMFDALTKEAGEHGILDWGISQTRCACAVQCRCWRWQVTDAITRYLVLGYAAYSLEDVFLRIIGEDDAQAD